MNIQVPGNLLKVLRDGRKPECILAMYESQLEFHKAGKVCKVAVQRYQRSLRYSEVLVLWQHDRGFRSFFISLLSHMPYAAYCWELPPVTRDSVDRLFECVIVDCPKLAGVEADQITFGSCFSRATAGAGIITFPNLGRDALLIVPCPQNKISAYAHIAVFIREAPEIQKHAMLKCLGREIQHRIGEHALWVNTAGQGVHWLHVRLDSYPKYYSYQPYTRSG